MTKELPLLSEELIKQLEKLYPNRCPDIQTPDRQIWMDAGAASVVKFLRQELERQKRNGTLGPTQAMF